MLFILWRPSSHCFPRLWSNLITSLRRETPVYNKSYCSDIHFSGYFASLGDLSLAWGNCWTKKFFKWRIVGNNKATAFIILKLKIFEYFEPWLTKEGLKEHDAAVLSICFEALIITFINVYVAQIFNILRPGKKK